MRALKTGNPNIVVAAAAELPRLSLADALLVLLVFARARAPADRGGRGQVGGAIRGRGTAGARCT